MENHSRVPFESCGTEISFSISDVLRFTSRFQVRHGQCWEWTGPVMGGKMKYGSFSVRRMTLGAHIVSYLLFRGDRNGLFVLHSCDNPQCVNPSHLFLGTARDNMRDCANKGRLGGLFTSARTMGENNSHAKLTRDQVAEIRQRFASGIVSKAALAREYGVSPPMIGYITNRRCWEAIL